MRRVPYLFTVLLLLAGCRDQVAWPVVEAAIRAEYPDVRQISTDSLAALLRQDVDVLLIDAREPEEYAVSHIAGAARMNPDARDFRALDSTATDAPIVVYCSVGYRSSRLASSLQEAGYTNVANLEGSIFRWANEGRAVVRDGVPVREVHPYDGVWARLLEERLRAPLPESTR